MFKERLFIFKPVFQDGKGLRNDRSIINVLLDSFNRKICKNSKNKIKKLCKFVFKRTDFFLITNIYINNKLVYVSTFEKYWKTVGFFRFIKKIFFKVIKIFLKKFFKFDRILFVVQVTKERERIRKKINRYKKKLNGKKKFRSRFIKVFFFWKIIKRLVLLSWIIGKRAQVKILFNCSHSHIREKLKKKRRK